MLIFYLNYLFGDKHVEYRWGQWSAIPLTCSVTCGSGVTCRVRSCLDGYGNVQSSTIMCESENPYESQAKKCIPCYINARCPRVPGWGTWSSWSSCSPLEVNQRIDGQRCHTGSRTRYRLCNNPPPEPHGFNCSGINQQVSECDYNCVDGDYGNHYDIGNKITSQVAKDQLNLNGYQNVLRMRVKQTVRMDCTTPAYNLARKLTSRGVFSLSIRRFKDNTLKIKWFKNGRQINPSDFSSKSLFKRFHKIKKTAISRNTLVDEEINWNLLLEASSFYMEDTYLIFPSISQGDQGFYTCQMTLGSYKWDILFYTLIVTGIKHVALEGDAFYLHSNLGYFNALDNAAVWMESAQIVWQLNGCEYTRGLALRLNRRIQFIPYLNLTHHGTWKCFLYIPAYDSPKQVYDPRKSISRIYLINEFYLKINPTQYSLWLSAEHLITAKTLKQTSLILSMIGLFLCLIISLNIWAARCWTKQSLTIDQQKVIVQELLNNECKLLLTCKKRANLNKKRLLRLILQDNQRLQENSRMLSLNNKHQQMITN
ncbi:Hemicentin-1 [Schistosoma japonicum]|uniref:Hemicentin-1 n=1 Tax=Schistosoma japonicum TaxID=6182 RepID=A0A4Z2DFM7_SCHJA|nr:Hemicentin-1 [Schistosoma japonicum]